MACNAFSCCSDNVLQTTRSPVSSLRRLTRLSSIIRIPLSHNAFKTAGEAPVSARKSVLFLSSPPPSIQRHSKAYCAGALFNPSNISVNSLSLQGRAHRTHFSVFSRKTSSMVSFTRTYPFASKERTIPTQFFTPRHFSMSFNAVYCPGCRKLSKDCSLADNSAKSISVSSRLMQVKLSRRKTTGSAARNTSPAKAI